MVRLGILSMNLAWVTDTSGGVAAAQRPGLVALADPSGAASAPAHGLPPRQDGGLLTHCSGVRGSAARAEARDQREDDLDLQAAGWPGPRTHRGMVGSGDG